MIINKNNQINFFNLKNKIIKILDKNGESVIGYVLVDVSPKRREMSNMAEINCK